jgi:hypothetical protein
MDGAPPEESSTTQAGQQPFRADDPNNVPLAKARARFLEQLALHTPILPALLHAPAREWKSLSSESREEIERFGWAAICPLDESEISVPNGEDPKKVAFCCALVRFGHRYRLTQNGKVATWAMETAIETIIDHLRPRISIRPRKRRKKAQWVHSNEMSQAYPAMTGEGWIHTATGAPERELCTIVIEIAPKQPSETFKDFETRFNSICRTERKEYVRRLKDQDWRLRHQDTAFTWIDRFALWQAGRSTAEIDPSIKTKSDRVKFSQGIKRISDYIQITPRESKHNPNRRRRH